MGFDVDMKLANEAQWQSTIALLAGDVGYKLQRIGRGEVLDGKIKDSLEKGKQLCRLMLGVAKAQLNEVVTQKERDLTGGVPFHEIFEVFQGTGGTPVAAELLKQDTERALSLLNQLFQQQTLDFSETTFLKDYFRWLAQPFSLAAQANVAATRELSELFC